MMKWLRAHSKQIMVITVLLAMFSFVGGSALIQILSPSQDKDPVVKAFDVVYTYRDIHSAQLDTDILARMGLSWQYDQPDQRMSVEHWHCLAEEARRAGLAVSDAEIDYFLEQISPNKNPAEVLEFLRVRDHFTAPQVRHALRRHLLIMKNAQHLGAAAAASEPQLRHFIKDTQDKVSIEFVALDAEKFVDSATPIPEEQLQAQFEKYKDVASSESETGFGYKHPRRVKLQYVLANLKTIEPLLSVSFDDVKNHWKANKSKYRKIIYETPPATSEPATSQSTSAPTSQPQPVPKSVEKPISEARADIERELRKKNALRLAELAMGKLAVHLQKPWLEERTDSQTGYKPIPAGVNDPKYLFDMFEKVAREFGIALEYHETGLESASRLEAMSDLRNAEVSGEGGQGLKLSELAFRVPQFFKHEPGTETTMCLQLFQAPDSPLAASDFNIVGLSGWTPPKDRLILFRVVEAVDAQPAGSLAEVRAQVEKDLRVESAMKALEPRVNELYAASRRIGLKEAWPLFADLRKKMSDENVKTPSPFARFVRKSDTTEFRQALMAGKNTLDPPDIAGIGPSRKFVDACFEMAAEGYSAPEVEAPPGEPLKLATTRPAAAPPPIVCRVSLPTLDKWCVVQLLKVDRVDSSKYEGELREDGYMRLSGERGAYLLGKWFNPQNIEKRCRFERIQTGPRAIPPREGIKEETRPHPLLDFQ
jgi:hypothetical protein